MNTLTGIDSIADMSTTLTIRNLDETVKQKLRLRAAQNQTSMEAEARAILTQAVEEPQVTETPSDREALLAERRKRIESVVGIWKDRADRRTTDEIMRELRGED